MSSVEDFKKILNDTDKPVFVMWSAKWCVPCRSLKPVFLKFSSTSTTSLYIIVDVDNDENMSLEYNITKLPTIKVFKNGKVIEEMKGSSENNLKNFIKKHDK